jgi:hypothetical protein
MTQKGGDLKNITVVIRSGGTIYQEKTRFLVPSLWDFFFYNFTCISAPVWVINLSARPHPAGIRE